MANGISLAAVDAELNKVLRPLTGLALYTDNVFRITGLPVDATPVQVRRRREEMAVAAKFGAPAPAVDGQAWMQPETDAEALRNAFEAMRNPVLRLTHELLWLRPDVAQDHPHNRTVRSHGELLRLEADGPESRLESAETSERWGDCLDDWAETFARDETWERARRRVREIDDPRLTIATVRRLQERLPALVIGVNVAVAVHAVRSSDVETAWRHMELLEDSDFPDAQVHQVTRATVEPAVTKIEQACDEAEQLSGPGKGLEPLHRMLADVDTPLLVVTTLLDDDDPLTEALQDRVAGTVNGCAVQYFNETSDGKATLPMLRRASELARDPEVAGLVERNIAVVEAEIGTGREVAGAAPPGPAVGTSPMSQGVPHAIAELCRRGGVNAAAARMRAWRRWTRDWVAKHDLSMILDDPRGLVSPVQNVPATGCFFFLGGHLYGAKDMQVTSMAGGVPDYTCVRTYFLTFLWIPLIPISAHITGWDSARGAVYGGRVPLGPVARWYRLLVLLGLPVTAFALFYGLSAAAIALVAGVLVAFTVVCLVLRQIYLYSWVRRNT